MCGRVGRGLSERGVYIRCDIALYKFEFVYNIVVEEIAHKRNTYSKQPLLPEPLRPLKFIFHIML
jgi:hypothetical protein